MPNDTDPKPAQQTLDGPPTTKKAAAKKEAAPRRPGRPTKRETTIEQLETSLNEAIAGIGLITLGISPADGVVVMARGPQLATALAHYAAENDAVRKFLERALAASAIGQVFIAVAAIAVPIAANHGVVPAQLGEAFGKVDVPEDLGALFGAVPDFPPADGG